MKTEVQVEEYKEDLRILGRRLSALSSLVYDRLETAETNVESEWVENNIVAKKLYEETAEDLYLIATVLSDIEKSVEQVQIKKA